MGYESAPARQVRPKGGVDPEEQRPFELVKYFSVTSLVIMLLFSLFISTVISRRAGSQAQDKRGKYALLLAENLNHQVMTRFVVPTIKEYGGINVGQPEQFKLLDAVVKNSIQSFRVRQVNILDLEGNIIYSTEPRYISRVESHLDAFSIAAAGGYVSVLDPPLGIFEMGGGPVRALRTYIPLRDERRRTAELGPPRAVFEITLDITRDFQEVWVDQLLVMGTLFTMMALLFMILRSIVTRGQRIMDRRAAEEAKLKERLNQSERLASLGRMIAGVAHEVRNPLGIIRSTAELLGSQLKDPQKPLAQVIVEESTRLNRIVSEFLDFARPQAPKLEAIEIEQVISHNLHVLAPEAERLGIKIERSYQNPPVKAWGDADLLYRGFLNIFNNSIQAMGEDGGAFTISTSSQRQDGVNWVVTTIDDTGPGFDQEAKSSLLDPFFTTKETGTGLGLSIVGNIINSHDGHMELLDAPGGGARVQVWLKAVGD